LHLPKSTLRTSRQVVCLRSSGAMATSVKRLRSLSPSSSQAIRPPKQSKTASSPFVLSIMSWNVDNPSPYLNGPGRSSSSSKPITSYLKRSNGDSRSSSSKNSPSKPAPSPSLHEIFAAHAYPAVCCLQEVRCLAKDADGIRALRRSAMPATSNLGSSSSSDEDETDDNKPDSQAPPTYSAHFSLCKSSFGAKRFGVGTFVSSRFPYQYSTREVDWDSEGRVLIMTIPSLKVAIVNVYALNGSDFPWKDPITGKAKGTRNERKRDFNRLLQAELQKMREQGLRLVCIGDFNISLEKRDCHPRLRTEEPHAQARKEFNEQFIPSLEVIDIFRELHGDKHSYSVNHRLSRARPSTSKTIKLNVTLFCSGSLDTNQIDLMPHEWIMPSFRRTLFSRLNVLNTWKSRNGGINRITVQSG
jgi:exonuclease III